MTWFRTLSLIVALATLGLALGGCPPKPQPPPVTNAPTPPPAQKYVIGFSQCTTTEPWRVLFNDLLIKEADKHPEVELIVQDAQDRTSTQEEQTRSFITQGVDAILISPKEAAGLTGVVEDATAAGIPVVVLDRDVDTKDYAAFVGGDNMEIGREAGKYAVEALGGEGQAQGVIYEIWGGMGSTPAQERHGGFAEIVQKEPGIKLIGKEDGDWKQAKGLDIMETALKAHDHIDIVYAHNDPMAYGAYLAAEEAGRHEDMRFIGIDAIPTEGCQWVKKGYLAATFVYPPPGVKGLQVALDILKGNPPEDNRIMLPTKRITKETVDEYLKEQGISPLPE